MRSIFRHMVRGKIALLMAVVLLGSGAIYAAAPPRDATPA